MASAIPDLWPELEQSQVVPPVAILREQAAALGKKAKHLLEGNVETRTTPSGKFNHTFYIVAPALENYTYELYSIEQGADQYPVVAPRLTTNALAGPPQLVLQTETELLEYVRDVLNSDRTKRIVGSLLAQVKATT